MWPRTCLCKQECAIETFSLPILPTSGIPKRFLLNHPHLASSRMVSSHPPFICASTCVPTALFPTESTNRHSKSLLGFCVSQQKAKVAFYCLTKQEIGFYDVFCASVTSNRPNIGLCVCVARWVEWQLIRSSLPSDSDTRTEIVYIPGLLRLRLLNVFQ